MTDQQPASRPAPVDSAFTGGALMLPSEASATIPAPGEMDAFLARRSEQKMNDALILACTVLILLFIRRIAGIMPALARCALRWRECLVLEYSMKASRDRNICTAVLLLPLCLIVYMSGFLSMDSIASMQPPARFAATLGILLCYLLVRSAARLIVNRRKIDPLYCDAAFGLFPTFLCLTAAVLIPASAVLMLANASPAVSRSILLYISGAMYVLMLLRKYQIFSHSCKMFTTILYLCALEIFPTGLLVSAALIF